MIKGSRILVTGGTGSLGNELTRRLCRDNDVVVYSRNEERQYEMQQRFQGESVEFFIGDVRDRGSLDAALSGCDIAIHAAAMKDLIMCERQPTQAYLNNIEGSRTFIEAVTHSSVAKAVGVSTDKAASPSSVYGASKYIMEKLFEEADRHCPKAFFSVRFGNMIDSRGSLIDIWKSHPEREIKLTHPEVSRFFFSVRDAALTVIESIERATGGEVFIRKMKKARIYDILKLITGRSRFEMIGLYPGEKLHEDLVSRDEVRCCHEEGPYYVIRPGKINPNPPQMFNTENAEAFSPEELKALVFPDA